MQEDGVPIFIMLIVAAAIVGVFVFAAIIVGVLLMPAL